MSEAENRPTEKRVITPLWIIGLFISLTEAVLSIAVTQTTGAIQTTLTVFVIAFALLVAGAFFVILWNRPLVLYAPKDYGSQTSVLDFVQALQYRPSVDTDTSQQIEDTIKAVLTSDESLAGLAEEQISHVIGQINKELFLTIDSRPLQGRHLHDGEGRIWRVLYHRYTNLTEFLKDIERAIAGPVAFPFGSEWLLRNAETGRLFEWIEMGPWWANRMRTGGLDYRRLEAVGILPGMTLEVVPFNLEDYLSQRRAA